jgi:protein gp37
MAENSKIEWTTHTFNPWIGCQKVSPGCDHCYAEAMMDHRYHKVQWGPHGERKRTSEAARLTGERPRVFCASLADVFDNKVPADWRSNLFDLIAETPELDWLLLTKRPENMTKMLPPGWDAGWPNIWIGTTAENQEQATRRGRILRDIPARVRFLSCEPLLSEISFEAETLMALDWIIVGGESGGDARMMQAWWAEDIHDQCKAAGIYFFMKQMTGKRPIPANLMVREFPLSAGQSAGE